MKEQGGGTYKWRLHPERDRLLAEAHARPYVALVAPVITSRLATVSGEHGGAADRAHMAALCTSYGQSPPAATVNWHALDTGRWQLRWERHTEFSSWTFFSVPRGDDLFAETALDAVPQDWLEALPGEMMVATRLELRSRGETSSLAGLFDRDMVAASLNDDSMSVFTDFRTDSNGMTRFLLYGENQDRDLSGRIVRSLLEIETYRLMALLAFPLAGEAARVLEDIEREATELASQLAEEAEPLKDRALLARLATLAGRAEQLNARTNYRFGAGRAYHEIVRDRIASLHEQHIRSLPTLGEFMERRLAPAMRTCDSIAARERLVIERIARTEQMLNTRVEVASEAASMALLASMDRRAKAQLRLQKTVEGLSVAAISYYAMGLLFYMLEAAGKLEPRLDPVVMAGIFAIPVTFSVWLLLHRLRRTLDIERD